MPPFQRPQGAPDRRPTSLGLGHRPAHTRQQQQSDPSCQANSKEEINFVSCRVEGFQTFSRGFRQQPCVRWLQFSARAPRFWSGGFVLSFSLFPLQKISISPRSSIRPRAGSRQARPLSPSMFMAQLPQMPSRQLRRKEIDQPTLIPHIAEAKSQKYSYEVLFRSLQKLLIDTATSEYLFTDDFFGEESIFHDIFAGPY
ncbi:hypothetical protein ACJX0J_035820, partial [Zea mays]